MCARPPLQSRDGRCPARTGDLLLVRREQLLRSTAACRSDRSRSDSAWRDAEAGAAQLGAVAGHIGRGDEGAVAPGPERPLSDPAAEANGVHALRAAAPERADCAVAGAAPGVAQPRRRRYAAAARTTAGPCSLERQGDARR